MNTPASGDFDDDDYVEEVPPLDRRDIVARGKYADCPHCENAGHAKPVSFTWWGGVLGPNLISHVRCKKCGTCYNGKSGQYNTTAIIIYVLVSFVIGTAVFYLLFFSNLTGPGGFR
jgi:hypothetical protein